MNHTYDAEIPFKFRPTGSEDFEIAYPEVRITYRYSPGRPAYTPRGEYAPVDPPEEPEVDVVKVELLDADELDERMLTEIVGGSSAIFDAVCNWVDEHGYEVLCREAEDEDW